MTYTLPPLSELDPSLTRDSVFEFLTKILNFALDTVTNINHDNAIWGENIDPILSYGDKAAVETSLLLLVVSRIKDLPESHRLQLKKIAEKLEPLVRNPHNRTLVLRFPQIAAAFGISHLALKGMGRNDEFYEFQIKQAFSNGIVESVERLPYRIMDVRWLRSLLFENSPAHFNDLLHISSLNCNSHPIYMLPLDIYALTHGLMYTTDFGRFPVLTELDVEKISSFVDAGISSCLLRGDLDILGELLICSSLLGEGWTSYAKVGCLMLTRTLRELEFLPSPSFKKELFTSLDEDNKKAYSFRHTYHTMFVAGILFALLLRHPESGETANDSPACSLDSVQPVLQLISSYNSQNPTTNTMWNILLRNDLALPNELDMVLMDALLIQSCVDYNLPALGEALLTIVDLEAKRTSTFYYCLHFLREQKMLNKDLNLYSTHIELENSPNAKFVANSLYKCIDLLDRILPPVY